MSYQFSVVVGLSLLIAAALYTYLSVRNSIPLKYVRRCEQRERFKAFVKTALSPELHQAHLDHFWQSTSDCHALFTSYPVLRLRRELFDHAKILVDLQRDDQWSESQVEWLDLRHEALAWFSAISDQIDGVFEPETTRNNALPQVIDEFFRLTGRSLRT